MCAYITYPSVGDRRRGHSTYALWPTVSLDGASTAVARGSGQRPLLGSCDELYVGPCRTGVQTLDHGRRFRIQAPRPMPAAFNTEASTPMSRHVAYAMPRRSL